MSVVLLGPQFSKTSSADGLGFAVPKDLSKSSTVPFYRIERWTKSRMPRKEAPAGLTRRR